MNTEITIKPAGLDYRIGTLGCGHCRARGCDRCAGSGRVLDPAFDPETVEPPEDRPLCRQRLEFMLSTGCAR